LDARWRIVECCHKPGYVRAERVMSRGLGRIERVIAARIASDAAYPMAVRLGSGQLAHAVYRPAENSGAGIGNPGTLWSWKPNLVQRKATARAMHSFVRKHQQYALVGGQGRKSIYLYDTADPVSVTWAKLSVKHRRFVSQQEAIESLGADHDANMSPPGTASPQYHQPRRSNGARANISIRVSSGP
jgi:hypothetical protein